MEASPLSSLIKRLAAGVATSPRLARMARVSLRPFPGLRQRLRALAASGPRPHHAPADLPHLERLLLPYKEHAAIELVAMAYLVFLRRPADPEALRHWRAVIDAGRFDPAALVASLLGSPEYRMLDRVPFHEMVHRSRQAWMQGLGPYRRILDIGGSSPNVDQGAMIELGYSHRPESLVIFDLPPERQYWGQPRFPQDRPYTFSWGSLRYVHGEAEAIAEQPDLADQTFDLVFMGQVIEHLRPEALPDVLKWIRDHLAPEGRFIFDTPNRRVTAIQSPDAYIDEDHKIEYTPEQLRAILVDCGFSVVRETGMLHMPGTCHTGAFDPLETYEHDLLHESANECYLFAFECADSRDAS